MKISVRVPGFLPKQHLSSPDQVHQHHEQLNYGVPWSKVSKHGKPRKNRLFSDSLFRFHAQKPKVKKGAHFKKDTFRQRLLQHPDRISNSR